MSAAIRPATPQGLHPARHQGRQDGMTTDAQARRRSNALHAPPRRHAPLPLRGGSGWGGDHRAPLVTGVAPTPALPRGGGGMSAAGSSVAAWRGAGSGWRPASPPAPHLNRSRPPPFEGRVRVGWRASSAPREQVHAHPGTPPRGGCRRRVRAWRHGWMRRADGDLEAAHPSPQPVAPPTPRGEGQGGVESVERPS